MQIRKAHYGIFCKIVIFVPVYSTYHFRHAVQGHSDISQRSCEDIASGGGTGGRYLFYRLVGQSHRPLPQLPAALPVPHQEHAAAALRGTVADKP